MKKPTKTTVCICTAAAVAAAAYLTFENEAPTLSEYEIIDEKVPESFDGFKILHLSDIHAKRPRRLHRDIIRLAEEQSPDVIVITGDLIDCRSVNISCAVNLAERLSEIAPIYYVTGNHEEKLKISDYTEALSGLSQAGVQILDSRSEVIERDGERIALCGIFDTPSPRAADMEGLFDAELFNVALFHRPQYGGLLTESGADLVLSGHAHGGQMRIPCIGGVIAPDQWFFPKYTEGLHRLAGGSLIISRGVGNSLIPVRVNNRPEVVCIRLKAGK